MTKSTQRLAVSNIAWTDDEEDEVLSGLRGAAVDGIEVAPTRFWPRWEGITHGKIAEQRMRLRDQGMDVPALQAIFYGRTDLSLFSSGAARNRLFSHMERVLDIANGLGATALVLGAPALRKYGEGSEADQKEMGKETLMELGLVCSARDVALCIEPIPPAYGGEFLADFREILELLANTDPQPKGLRLQFDTACLFLGGHNPADALGVCKGQIGHFHVSEPHLGNFAPPVLEHTRIGEALLASDYQGWISLEMRAPGGGPRQVLRAVDHVMTAYLIGRG